jgi:alkaline phosphatase D
VKLMSTPTTWRRNQPFSALKHYVVERGRPALNEV